MYLLLSYQRQNAKLNKISLASEEMKKEKQESIIRNMRFKMLQCMCVNSEGKNTEWLSESSQSSGLGR